MIDREHDLSITQQAEALNISRGSVYYLRRPVSANDLEVMRRLDRLHLRFPFGSRMLRGLLAAEGCKIGRRHVKTLMRPDAPRVGARHVGGNHGEGFAPARRLRAAAATNVRLIEPLGANSALQFYAKRDAPYSERKQGNFCRRRRSPRRYEKVKLC